MQAPKIIPNYPNYTITEEGKVYNRKTKRFLRPTYNKCVSLCSRVSKRSVSITRLLKENFPPPSPILPEQPAIDGRTTKLIPGFPDYTVTATGRVYDRKRKCEQRPTSGGKIIMVNREERTSKSIMVAQLVAEVFIAPSPGPYTRIRHLDGDKKNNHVDNLCWVQKNNVCKPCPKCGRAHWLVIKYGVCLKCWQQTQGEHRPVQQTEHKQSTQDETCSLKTECLQTLENIFNSLMPKSDS